MRRIEATCTAAALVAALAAPAAAQCHGVPDDDPAAGRCNWVPFGQAYGDPTTGSQRYQTVLTTADLGGQAGSICGLAFAPCGPAGAAATGVYRIDTLTIKMAQIAAGSTLSTTFDSNLTAPVTVLDVRDHYWQVRGDQWNDIGLQRPFAWDPANGDLVVEIVAVGTGLWSGNVTTGMRRHAGRQRVFDYGWSGAPPAVARFDDSYALKVRACIATAAQSTFGVGCPAARPLVLSYTGSSRLGSTLTVGVAQGPAGGAGTLLLGLSNGAPYPTDLTPVGLPGCWLWISQETTFPLVFAAGTAAVSVPVPTNPSLLCSVFYNQAIAVDAAAPGGASASDYGRAVIGS